MIVMRILLRGLILLPALLLSLLVLPHLWFFAQRAWHLLSYPFPLDYGEGPLQAQLLQLLNGSPIWGLYRDPGQAPFLVINYPPIYHLVVWPLAWILSNALPAPQAALLAGRVVSLVSGIMLAVVVARLALVSTPQRPQRQWWSLLLAALVGAALLGIPIVREWSSVMRVDMLGVCCGLWALLLIQANPLSRRQLIGTALLLAATLLVKPSLLAAPVAAIFWLFFRNQRHAITLALLTGAIGLSMVGVFQIASGGWFWLHVVQANTNPWDADLARNFWRDQLVLLTPLLAAGAIGLLLRIERIAAGGLPATLLLPLVYGLCGLLTALGIGKLGAYTNYFLEAYAGAFWLLGALAQPTQPTKRWQNHLAPTVALLGATLALTRYYPLWSEEYLLPAGIIEGQNPARISLGGYGVADDLAREEVILAARWHINQALQAPLQASTGVILTDVPGVVSQYGQESRLQIFEHRMLIDLGLFDQRPLLRDLANGQVPLVVLDYLGNWLTDQQIRLITHRYAQDVSIGTYSIYRPVATGSMRPLEQPLAGGIALAAAALPEKESFSLGEQIVATLAFRAENPGDQPITVVLGLADSAGNTLLTSERELLYGALPPHDWGDQTIEHLQPLSLPYEILPGTYRLNLTLRIAGQESAAAIDLGSLTIGEGGGMILGEQGFFVPEPFLAEWERLGGYAGPGDPVTPAVPFAGFTQQCYKTTCLRLAAGMIERLPIGELTWMADAGLPRPPQAAPEGQISPEIAELYQQLGGEAVLGPVLGSEMKRFGDIVLYTRYARLERPLEGGPARLGNVGEDVLRLPGGTPYRWPGG